MTQVRPDRQRREPLRARPKSPAPEVAAAPPAPSPWTAPPGAQPDAPGPAHDEAVPAPGAPSQTPPGSDQWSPMSAPPPPQAAPPSDQHAASPTSSSNENASDQHNPLRAAVDTIFRQGATGDDVVWWRPAAAGAVLALGGVIILLQALINAELVDILLTIGLSMLVAGFMDGTGRRYRGPGIALTSVAIIARFVGDVSWLAEGWGFGIFLVAYGAYVVVERQRHR